MMLDYLECKIGHRSSKKGPIENSLVSPQADEHIAHTAAETPQGCQFLTSANIQVQQDKDENWETVKKFYKVEFKEGENLKRPLINPDKRKILSTLMKNDHLTIKNIHNHMLEKIVYQK
ncbi:hypothetical protein FGO68_gene11246 [Halteria grandinella]|uniref:Uncharacterized protein n=1 Tax=Halteria grandinella TaxID=5974 RepID=A0A8J8NWU4_HALGN|nr:hypothetical protein FGO68_gene11246 [Halteria grandinella]